VARVILEIAMHPEPIPVTVLTGFLGAGKTTLLRHMLQAEHGLKLAVIENEFSETPIDGQLLGDKPVELLTLANGCVCCSIHVELEKALFLLLDKLDAGELAFDRLVIECTGLADPAPVAQTFFADEELAQRYVLDGIVTLVDAVNAERHLQEAIAQAQVGFADRILLSKTDLAEPEQVEALRQRLARINRRAPLRVVEHGRIDLAELLDIRGFNLNADVAAAPLLRPLVPVGQSADRIRTLVLSSDKPLDMTRLSAFMEDLLERHGNSLLRYKGVLDVAGDERRLVFQGVLRLYGFDWDEPWGEGETRQSVLVFIGDNLPEDEIRAGFAALAPLSLRERGRG
jgi:G3E family GTPase